MNEKQKAGSDEKQELGKQMEEKRLDIEHGRPRQSGS